MSVDESMPDQWEHGEFEFQRQQVEMISNFAHTIYSAGKIATSETQLKNEPLVISDAFADSLIILDPEANDERNNRVRQAFPEEEIVTVQISGNTITVDGHVQQVKIPDHMVVYNVLLNNPGQQVSPKEVVESAIFENISPYRARYDKARTFGQAIKKLNHPFRLTGKLISIREGAARNSRHQLAPYVVIEPIVAIDQEAGSSIDSLWATYHLAEAKLRAKLTLTGVAVRQGTNSQLLKANAEELAARLEFNTAKAALDVAQNLDEPPPRVLPEPESAKPQHKDIIDTEEHTSTMSPVRNEDHETPYVNMEQPVAQKVPERIVRPKTVVDERIRGMQKDAINHVAAGDPFTLPQRLSEIEHVAKAVVGLRFSEGSQAYIRHKQLCRDLMTKIKILENGPS